MRRGLAIAATVLALTACEQTLYLDVDGGVGSSNGGAGGLPVFGNGGGLGGGGGGDQHCSFPSAQALPLTPDQPQLLVMLDRSTNMNAPFGGNDTQFTAAVDALNYEVGAHTGFNHPPIEFSFLDFPDSSNGCSQLGCCTSDVIKTTTQQDFINADYACTPTSTSPSCVVSDNRPIGAALAKVSQALTGQSNGPRYVLLVTDGPPQGNCTKGSDDCTWAEQQVSTLENSNGVRALIVIAINDQNPGDCLLSLGGGPQSSNYYRVANYTDLVTALDSVASGLVCHFTLSSPLSSDQASNLQVWVSNRNYPNDPTSGWTYDPTSNRLHLHGPACDAYSMSGNVMVYSGCGHGP